MTEDTKFDGFIEQTFEELMKREPDLATALGVHKYDELMPRGTKKAFLEELKWLRTVLLRLKKFDPKKLSIEKKIDRTMAIRAIEYIIYRDYETGLLTSYPYSLDRIGMALYLVFTREFAPFEKRIEILSKRMLNSVTFLEESKELLTTPKKLWLDIGIETCERFPEYLMYIPTVADQMKISESVYDKLLTSCEILDEAIIDYKNFLEELKKNASNDYVVGEKIFRTLLKKRGFRETPEQLLKLGRKYLVKEKKELATLAKQIDKNSSVEEIRTRIKKNHPTSSADVLREYQNWMKKTREFVISKKFATIPENEKLEIMETPEYTRNVVPFAAYIPPGKFDSLQNGIFWVTPPEQESQFEEHNYASIMNTAIHEGYPGHHLQHVYTNKMISLPRYLGGILSTEYIEGWAHYCEDAVREIGFPDTLESRFTHKLDMIWRAVRVIIDVKLSCGKMSFDEAVNFLVNETGMTKESAIAEVKRYTYNPGYQLSYLYGKDMFIKLRKEAQKVAGKKFDIRKFHDAILRIGPVSPDILQKAVLKEVLRV